MSSYKLILLACIVCIAIGARFSPDLNKNQLRFSYGVNFKYNGMLHHNMARVWIVTKFPIPNFKSLLTMDRKVLPNCEFKNDVKQEHESWLKILKDMCEASKPQIKLIKERELAYKRELNRLLQEEIFTALPNISPAGRTKRFAAAFLPAIAGLVTLAVESISGYLQSKRNRMISMAMDELKTQNRIHNNRLNRYKSDLLMYGNFQINSSEKLVDSLCDMYDKITLVEEYMVNHTDYWLSRYLSDSTGVARYANDMAIYLSTLNVKFLDLYRDLLHNVEKLLMAIKTLSEGKIPITLIPPKMLEDFTENVKQQLQNYHPDYTLAMPHISYYYDMKLVTFGTDNDGALIVSFPIFIRPIHSKPLTLYEIETVDVPVIDSNEELNSYTRVKMTKPYLAANRYHYIQLQMQELNMCKLIQRDFFCEELFMVKQNYMHTCESLLFYNRDVNQIPQVCEFELALNKSVIPSVLDAGHEIVLANLDLDKRLSCQKRVQIKLPKSPYLLTNRSILCACSIESKGSFLSPDIGACSNVTSIPDFKYTRNLAFQQLYEEIIKVEAENGIHTEPPKLYPNIELIYTNQAPPPFPIDLNKTSMEARKSSLRDWVTQETKLIKGRMNETSNYPKPVHTNNMTWTEIDLLNSKLAKINFVVIALTFCLMFTYITWVACKVKKIKMLSTAIALQYLPQTHALDNTQMVCHDFALSVIFSVISVIGLIIWMYKICKGITLCRGHLLHDRLHLYLAISGPKRYVPIKMKTICGHIHKVHVLCPDPIMPAQVQIVKTWSWDSLLIDWHDTKMFYGQHKVHLPHTLSIPLIDKIRSRYLMAQPHEILLLAKQGEEWKTLWPNTSTTSELHKAQSETV